MNNPTDQQVNLVDGEFQDIDFQEQLNIIKSQDSQTINDLMSRSAVSFSDGVSNRWQKRKAMFDIPMGDNFINKERAKQKQKSKTRAKNKASKKARKRK